MKLNSFKGEIIIDYFPNPYQSKQRIFFTTVTHLTEIKLPTIIPKIYTSRTLMIQFINFFKNKGKVIKEDNFYILKNSVVQNLVLSDGTTIEVLPCEPENGTTNLFLVFRKGLKITHVYAGICLDLANVMANTTFVVWLTSCDYTIDFLYIAICDGCDRCADCELEKALKSFSEEVNSKNMAKIWVRFPPTGCEYFINCLATQYSGSVAISGLLRELYEKAPNVEMNHFTKDLDKAKIILSDEDVALDLKYSYGAPTESHLINWSPLPPTFELDLLIKIVRPKQIVEIQHNYALSRVPIYLTKFSFNKEQSKEIPKTTKIQNIQNLNISEQKKKIPQIEKPELQKIQETVTSEQKKETPLIRNVPQDIQYPSTSGLQKKKIWERPSTGYSRGKKGIEYDSD